MPGYFVYQYWKHNTIPLRVYLAISHNKPPPPAFIHQCITKDVKINLAHMIPHTSYHFACLKSWAALDSEVLKVSSLLSEPSIQVLVFIKRLKFCKKPVVN